jgi:hypothetical protein
LHALFDECRILRVGDVGETEHCRCFAQYVEEYVEAWPPLHANFS